MSNGAGACHVQVTFSNGATSSVDLTFKSQWMACGSDPQGCGEGFVGANADGGSIQALAPAAICVSDAATSVDAPPNDTGDTATDGTSVGDANTSDGATMGTLSSDGS
jgi:hypothetical protein